MFLFQRLTEPIRTKTKTSSGSEELPYQTTENMCTGFKVKYLVARKIVLETRGTGWHAMQWLNLEIIICDNLEGRYYTY